MEVFSPEIFSPAVSYLCSCLCILQHYSWFKPRAYWPYGNKLNDWPSVLYSYKKENQFSLTPHNTPSHSWGGFSVDKSFIPLKYVLGQLGLCLVDKNICLFFILIMSDPIMVFLLGKYIKRALKHSLISRLLLNYLNSQTSSVTA